ncbi:4'-phosphopantetheinyl transferase family protein [Undibacterium sp. Ji49W]|uniref:4'-phosphopantetheinyl transferase family protein n=1 Tax=Undibacterium sp. Ji49W TaxID=3413040 RepID=UPI003BF2F261
MPENTPSSSITDEPKIWVASLTDLRKYRTNLQNLLSSAEQLRCQRYQQQDDKDRYLGGRALAKLAVAQRTGMPVETISIRVDASGKPHIAFAQSSMAPPAISISHAGELIVVATAAMVDLGVDVELLHRDVDLDDLMRVVCSDREMDEINRQDNKSRTQKFYEFWVLKEAYLKATGDGLSADARRLIFSVDAASGVSLVQGLDKQAEAWSFLLHQFDKQHMIAVASRRLRARDECAEDRKIGVATGKPTYIDATSLLMDYCIDR